MVQRKVLNKLGVPADHIKSEELLVNLKPSSLQHQDIKSKGADLKKKMKKSGSMKRLEFDSLRSPNLRRHVEQPGKPPPPPAVAPLISAATPQKQSAATTPNYMKSTSSSVARKEQSQVSTKSLQISPDSSSLHRKNLNYSSKLSAASGHKPTKTLTRTNSLKMKRTLIKTPSFKPGRALMKKCAPVVFYENLDVQRATCSSTLKDCKLPAYLMLNPGGTESEGTSVMKVCPYTFCSLNGHHHDPLPPLKGFLSARRRMLKTQRAIKLGCLSPRRARAVGDDMNFDEKLLNKSDLDISTICPLAQEEKSDFFIEIYSTKMENTAEYAGIDQSASHSSITDLMPTFDGRDETVAQDHEEQVLETLSDGSICDDTDSHENLDESRDDKSTDTDAAAYPEVNVAEEVSLPSLAQEETELGFLSIQNDIAAESMFIVQSYELDSEASDMEWETGLYSNQYLDDNYEYLSKTDKQLDLEGGKVESCIIHDELIINSDNSICSCFNEFLADGESQETFDEDSLNSDTVSTIDDCGSVGSFDYLESLNNMKTAAPVEVPVEEPETVPQDEQDFLLEGNHTPGTVPQIGYTETCYDLMVVEETSFGYLTYKCLPNEDEIAVTGVETSDLLEGHVEKMVTCGGKAKCDTNDDLSNQTSLDAGLQIQAEEHLSDEYQTSNIENHEHWEKECSQTENFKSLSPMDPAEEPHSELTKMNPTEPECHMVHEVKPDNATKLETEHSSLARATANNKVDNESLGNNLHQDLITNDRIPKAETKCKRPIQDDDEEGHFNPRAPNFLPLEPDPEAEKVDLRHQELDEKKNAEEWMVDFALRQTVTKLGSARKKKVALLVEAFEKVMPVTKWEPHLRHSSALDHTRPIQACN